MISDSQDKPFNMNAKETTVPQDLKCPKCQGEMIQRFIPDYAPGA
jgi:cytochrome c-type biogenesis protein CcmH/NrfF